ncbi:Yip1 family protein [Undibacterium sp.]|uniref:Yip1 family protein n=1 Tax=Undibacterium sp. TaxID=1914977 RepID=UPI002732162B|nr:Yip1 family protein [Undibacterium sp.]MDP1978394.1 Yip1 family protein [Undibacterium sp.]
MNLARSVFNVLVAPRQEWRKISQENLTSQHVFVMTIMPLTAFFLVMGLLATILLRTYGQTTGAEPLEGDYLRMLVVNSVRAYGMGLLFIYIIARIMQGMSRRLGGLYSLPQALKLSIYSIVPLLVVKSMQLLPFFRIEKVTDGISAMVAMNFVASIYSIYLLCLGAPVLLEVPQKKMSWFILVNASLLMLLTWLPVILAIVVANTIGYLD